MNVRNAQLICVSVAGIVVSGCQSESGDQAAEVSSRQQAITNRVDIPPTVQKNLGMTFADVERRHVGRACRIPGSFEWSPEAVREYRLSLPGTVRLEVEQYQSISEGDILYRIRSPRWPEVQHELVEAEQAIETAHAAIELGDAKLVEVDARIESVESRLETLASLGTRDAELETTIAALRASRPRLAAELAVARTSLENAMRTREHAMHRAASASGLAESLLSQTVDHDGLSLPAYRTIDWIDVHADASGVVSSIAMTDGGYAESPELVLTTVMPEGVRFRGQAMQSDLYQLDGIDHGQLVPVGHIGAVQSESVPCQVLIGLNADPKRRTIDVLAVPDEMASWARAGVAAILELESKEDAGMSLAIPSAAVIQDGLVHVYFRRDPQDANKVIRVEADLGVDDGYWVEIQSGLSPHDQVVVNGVYELNLATSKDGPSRKGGHFHADGTWHEDDH